MECHNIGVFRTSYLGSTVKYGSEGSHIVFNNETHYTSMVLAQCHSVGVMTPSVAWLFPSLMDNS
jgi:hypothetical protein